MVPGPCKIDEDLNQTTYSQELTLAGQVDHKAIPWRHCCRRGLGGSRFLSFTEHLLSALCASQNSLHLISWCKYLLRATTLCQSPQICSEWWRKKEQLSGGKTGKVQSKFGAEWAVTRKARPQEDQEEIRWERWARWNGKDSEEHTKGRWSPQHYRSEALPALYPDSALVRQISGFFKALNQAKESS